MANFEELLSTKNETLKKQFIALLFKEELIPESVYYKALELLGKENTDGIIK